MNRIGANAGLHPDFGTVYNGAPNGIPYLVVPTHQPLVPVTLTPYGNEADSGPYPLPTNAPIEGGPNSTGDRHVLVLRQGDCKLFELYRAFPNANGSWKAYGAIFDLNSNALRPADWTSADAAGLPILSGLVKYEEVQAALAGDGVIHHALRFTVPQTYYAYLWPARHRTNTSTNPNDPPMGLRFRLKANFNLSGFSPSNQVILRTLKQYGMFVADNGSPFYLSGAPNPNWDDDDLHNLQTGVHGSDFEAVDESSLMVHPDSGQVGGTPQATVTATATRTQTPTRTNMPPASPSATWTPTGTRTSTPSPTPTCPILTPAPVYVDPVISPTDRFTQTIHIEAFGASRYKVTTRSGTFTNTSSDVTINLLPNTAHDLTASAHIENGACSYDISTIFDRNGKPLVIVQQDGTPPPSLGGCGIFPANSIFNTPIDTLPVDAKSDAYIQSIGANTGVHPDFGAGLWDGAPIGIPYNVVGKKQATSPVKFTYADESDQGPYPIPANPKIEGGSDRHLLIVQKKKCYLYELFAAKKTKSGKWKAGSGAIWDLNSNALRPSTWTSADAAGLPITPLLARYQEAATGEIRHALRFTASKTRGEFIWPARHEASDLTDPNVPPMGQRFRLKASFDESGFSTQTQVILRALKKFGMFLADNGSDWYISGAPNKNWNNDALVNELRQVKGSDFEAVDESSLMIDPNSGEANQP